MDELEKAQLLIRENKIASLVTADEKLNQFFIVSGTHDYLVILPNFCTCTHFHINCIKEQGKVCKHILACQMVGDNVREFEIDDWQDLLFRMR